MFGGGRQFGREQANVGVLGIKPAQRRTHVTRPAIHRGAQPVVGDRPNPIPFVLGNGEVRA